MASLTPLILSSLTSDLRVRSVIGGPYRVSILDDSKGEVSAIPRDKLL